MLVTLIVFILVFSIVVIAHELGHFLVAKLNGIKVLEFAIGMGPALLHFQKGETKYVLRMLPLGGACMFEGEDGVSSSKEGNQEESDGSFAKANVWARMATVFAGPFFNIVLAFLLSLIIVGFSGSAKPTVTQLTDGYPASAAGIEVGDVITRIDGEKIHLPSEVTLISSLNRGKALEVEYLRNGNKHKTLLTPKFSETDNRYYMGFTIGEPIECKGWKLVQYSAYEVRYWLNATVKSLLMLLQGQLSKDDLSGPVGIAVTIDETIEVARPYGLPTVILTMINFAVLLSVNLGVMNLLPIPALDGGRILFLLVEVIRGKPIPPEKEGVVHFVGFVALMVFMVFVMYNDIARIL